jgi:signal transduction histidine kinase
MSHELRTPLHSVLSFASFGVKKYATATPERLDSYFDMILQSGRTRMALLNDLLALAKLKAGKMTVDFQSTDLVSLISAVTDEFSPLVTERHLTIHWQDWGEKTAVVTDAGKIRWFQLSTSLGITSKQFLKLQYY